MDRTTIGLMHPGEMGAAVGACLTGRGHTVLWASAGRSRATAARARGAGLRDVGTDATLAARADVIVSVCPPHAAVATARGVAGLFRGVYLDANAVSPATAREVARIVGTGGASYVDGGIIGAPPTAHGDARLYLSGPGAGRVAGLFAGTALEARVLGPQVGAASAVKAAYAAWTKGTAALILAVRALARTEGVEDALLAEWDLSQPALPGRCLGAAAAAAGKGWRWAGEMDEIAVTMSAAGLPDGFHRAAAEVFRAVPREPAGGAGSDALATVLGALAADGRRTSAE